LKGRFLDIEPPDPERGGTPQAAFAERVMGVDYAGDLGHRTGSRIFGSPI
jgi:hypothetical protein